MGNSAWSPLADDQLTWFRSGVPLPECPRPLEYGGEVFAFVLGLTRALESLDFPLYEVRSRLFEGRLYLAVVPSARAEADLERKLRRAHDSSLRYTRDIRAGWERGPRREVEGYNEEIEAWPAATIFPTAHAEPVEAWARGDQRGLRQARPLRLGSGQASTSSGRTVVPPEMLADGMRELRRARGNQWFTLVRAGLAPAAMLQAWAGGTMAEDAQMVLRDGLEIVRGRGGRLFADALGRVGERLAANGTIAVPEDVWWLDWEEVRLALREGSGSANSTIAERKREAGSRPKVEAPPTVGPPLPDVAPRMYLVREILALAAH